MSTDWEKELIASYGGDDDAEAPAESAAPPGDVTGGEAAAPHMAADAAPAAADGAAGDAAPAADGAPSAGGLEALRTDVVKLRAEREKLTTLVAQWQKSVGDLEQIVQQATAAAQHQQQEAHQKELQRLQQLQQQLHQQQALQSQLLQRQQQQQQQQQQQPQSPNILTATGLQHAPQATHPAQAAAHPAHAAYSSAAYPAGKPYEAVAKKGSWAEFETEDGQARSSVHPTALPAALPLAH